MSAGLRQLFRWGPSFPGFILQAIIPVTRLIGQYALPDQAAFAARAGPQAASALTAGSSCGEARYVDVGGIGMNCLQSRRRSAPYLIGSAQVAESRTRLGDLRRRPIK